MLTITWRVPWSPSTIYTWFIADRWIRLFSFWLGMFLGSVGMLYYIHKKKQRKILELRPGGIDLQLCIEPDRIYEVVDKNLEKAIRAVLGNIKGLLIVEPSVAILANILLQKFRFQISNLGVSIVYQSSISFIRNTALSIGNGILTGSGVIYLLVTVMATPAFIALIAAFAIGSGVYFVSNKQIEAQECQNLIRAIQQIEIVIDDEPFQISPLDLPSGANPKAAKLFINGQFENTLYSSEQKLSNCHSSKESVSSLPWTNPSLKRKPSIRQKCQVDKKYVPLRERTKTLNDLKKYDDTALREESQKSMERYQDKTEKFRAKRIQIMNNRNDHDEF